MAEMQEQLKDHETRIREIERSQLEMKYNFLSLENSNKDIKLMIQELNKNQSELLNKFVTCTLDNSKTEGQIKITNNKNIWAFIFKVGAVIAPFITAGLTYVLTK